MGEEWGGVYYCLSAAAVNNSYIAVEMRTLIVEYSKVQWNFIYY
jgi:hypothetical protein